MLSSPPFPHPNPHPATADHAVAAPAGSDMERLVLALLRIVEKHEMEAGLLLHVTPPVTLEALAGLAGIGDYSAGLMLGYLLEAGFLSRRRQRFVLTNPEALYRLALGAAPL